MIHNCFFKNPEKQNSAFSFNKNKVKQPQVWFNFVYVVLTTVQILAFFLPILVYFI